MSGRLPLAMSPAPAAVILRPTTTHEVSMRLALALALACASDPAGEPAAAALVVAPPVPELDVAPSSGGGAGPCPVGDALIRCPAAGGREVLVCGGPAGLQYRFGPPGAPELVVPASPSTTAFTWEERHLVRAMGDVLSFANEGHVYEVVEMTGGGMEGEGEENNFVGVVVRKGGRELARVPCGPMVADWPAIRRALGR